MSAPVGPLPLPRPAADGRRWRVAVEVLGALYGAALLTAFAGPVWGLLWGGLAPRMPVVRTAGGADYARGVEFPAYVRSEGVFVLLGLGIGLAAVLVALRVTRRYPAGVLAASAAGLLGAGQVAQHVGPLVRPHGAALLHRLQAAPPGTVLRLPPHLFAGLSTGAAVAGALLGFLLVEGLAVLRATPGLPAPLDPADAAAAAAAGLPPAVAARLAAAVRGPGVSSG